ncbi:essential recombination function protein [Sporomusaceae bacterium FL31]|nr:essential recombination function protein [Sporomusaceae bacterium FL31]GCE32611.1 essential recombination function protein [Sporomusaceae bacterium]
MRNIASKLVRIMEECCIVKKSGTNDFHHYKYATFADVLEKVNAALAKNKVASIVLPEIIDTSDVMSSKGHTEHQITVKVEIMLIDTESGESISLAGIGSGQDGGDKAVMKAQTAAIKYAYLLSLAISANDDPEADSKTDEVRLAETTILQQPQNNALLCSECQRSITSGILNVSISKFGRPLCIKCQKKVQGAA